MSSTLPHCKVCCPSCSCTVSCSCSCSSSCIPCCQWHVCVFVCVALRQQRLGGLVSVSYVIIKWVPSRVKREAQRGDVLILQFSSFAVVLVLVVAGKFMRNVDEWPKTVIMCVRECECVWGCVRVFKSLVGCLCYFGNGKGSNCVNVARMRNQKLLLLLLECHKCQAKWKNIRTFLKLQ